MARKEILNHKGRTHYCIFIKFEFTIVIKGVCGKYVTHSMLNLNVISMANATSGVKVILAKSEIEDSESSKLIKIKDLTCIY